MLCLLVAGLTAASHLVGGHQPQIHGQPSHHSSTVTSTIGTIPIGKHNNLISPTPHYLIAQTISAQDCLLTCYFVFFVSAKVTPQRQTPLSSQLHNSAMIQNNTLEQQANIASIISTTSLTIVSTSNQSISSAAPSAVTASPLQTPSTTLTQQNTLFPAQVSRPNATMPMSTSSGPVNALSAAAAAAAAASTTSTASGSAAVIETVVSAAIASSARIVGTGAAAVTDSRSVLSHIQSLPRLSFALFTQLGQLPHN